MQSWVFDEQQLGAALDTWQKSKRPTADTAAALRAITDFLNSPAAGKLRVRLAATREAECNATR